MFTIFGSRKNRYDLWCTYISDKWPSYILSIPHISRGAVVAVYLKIGHNLF